MTQLQMELYKELETQGMPKAGSRFISQMFKNKKQEQAMLKYLISIRTEHVSVTEVSEMAHQIQTM